MVGRVPRLKQKDYRKKGTLILTSLLEDLEKVSGRQPTAFGGHQAAASKVPFVKLAVVLVVCGPQLPSKAGSILRDHNTGNFLRVGEGKHMAQSELTDFRRLKIELHEGDSLWGGRGKGLTAYFCRVQLQVFVGLQPAVRRLVVLWDIEEEPPPFPRFLDLWELISDNSARANN